MAPTMAAARGSGATFVGPVSKIVVRGSRHSESCSSRPLPLRQRSVNGRRWAVGVCGRRLTTVVSASSGFGGPEKESSELQAKRTSLVTNAASVPASGGESEKFVWGAKMKPLITAVMIGVIVSLIPCPEALAAMDTGLKAWRLLAIFSATIVGIITQPLPLGAVALIGLGATMVTQTLTFKQAFSAMASEIPWLIAIAFFFAKGFIKTGLGSRVAYFIVKLFGKTTLGLSYSLVFAEAVLAPAIPSLAARAGGIMLPLIRALCEACGSKPEDGTEKKVGAYLMFTSFQTSCVTSAMFLTAMAANPLAANLASASLGAPISWGQWAIGAIAPGLTSLIVIPLVLYAIYPPEVKESPDAPKEAAKQLDSMGPMKLSEKIMAGTLLVTVGLWIFGPAFGIGSVAAAIVGLTSLLVTGVLDWNKECLGQGGAWDTLTWFGALIAMADYLNKFGLIKWFSGIVTQVVGGLGLPWEATLFVLSMIYFYSHYAFASGAAHIGAMYTAFLSVSVALGSPPLIAALILGYFSNLMGCFTNYGIGSAPPIFGTGYVPQSKWFQYGFIISVVNIVIWLGVGAPWWKLLGYY